MVVIVLQKDEAPVLGQGVNNGNCFHLPLPSHPPQHTDVKNPAPTTTRRGEPL